MLIATAALLSAAAPPAAIAVFTDTENGMNVARLNMTHGNHAWHTQVVERIRKLNKEKG